MSNVIVNQTTDIAILIDGQRGFMPADAAIPGTGELPVPQGDAIIAPWNALCDVFDDAAASEDFHPADHKSFAVSWPGKAPFSTIDMPYGPQVLWPVHCVAGSPGAQLHPALRIDRIQLVVRKGFRREVDSYSAFRENDKTTETGLAAWLRARGKQRLFFAGLALDYCVGYSAEDAADAGFTVFVIEDACRGIAEEGVAAMKNKLTAKGVRFVTSGEVVRG